MATVSITKEVSHDRAGSSPSVTLDRFCPYLTPSSKIEMVHRMFNVLRWDKNKDNKDLKKERINA